jgi:hypothetical protein
MKRILAGLAVVCCWAAACGGARHPDDGSDDGAAGGTSVFEPACDLNDSCKGSPPCTFESGPCTVTFECLGSEGGDTWQGTDAKCDVPPVSCEAEEPDDYGTWPGPLLAPLATGDRCAFAGARCFYEDEAGCRADRSCLDDHTWSGPTTACEPLCHDSQVGDPCVSPGATCGWVDDERCTHERTCTDAHVWEGSDSC